jgi:dihydroneopterin aldolase
LQIAVHLGCSPEERASSQLVSFDIELLFKTAPEAMNSDNLDDTVCYATLAKAIKAYCQSKPFNLIEHLSRGVHVLVRKFLDAHASLVSSVRLSTRKLPQAVPEVHGGVAFSIEEK